MAKNETASLEKLPNFGILNFESCYGGGFFFTVALTICLLKSHGMMKIKHNFIVQVFGFEFFV